MLILQYLSEESAKVYCSKETGIRSDQIVTISRGYTLLCEYVSTFQDTSTVHVCSTLIERVHIVMHTSIEACFLHFSKSLYVTFNFKNFLLESKRKRGNDKRLNLE